MLLVDHYHVLARSPLLLEKPVYVMNKRHTASSTVHLHLNTPVHGAHLMMKVGGGCLARSSRKKEGDGLIWSKAKTDERGERTKARNAFQGSKLVKRQRDDRSGVE